MTNHVNLLHHEHVYTHSTEHIPGAPWELLWASCLEDAASVCCEFR